jgi:vitamin B12 transporter
VRLRADYTYTEARDDTTGLALLRRPVNKASVSAVWSPIDKLNVTTTLLYVSPWVDVDRSTFVRIVQRGYELAGVAAGYSVTNNWTLFGRIENLFNVQYEDPAGFLRPGFGIYGGVRLDVGALSLARPPILTKTAGGM